MVVFQEASAPAMFGRMLRESEGDKNFCMGRYFFNINS